MNLTVEELMSKKVITVETTSSAFDAAREIMNHEIGCVVVVKGEDNLVGVVTKGDILREVIMKKLDPQKVKVDQIMSQPVVMIESNASLQDASTLMMTNNVSKLPVMKGGKLVGMITSTDILRGSRPRKISSRDMI